VAVLVAVAAFAGCGSGDDPSADQLAQARREGAAAERERQATKAQRQKQAQLEARIKRLEQQLARAQKALEKKAPATSSTTRSSGSASRTSCGANLSVGRNTTCAFARNVYSAWYSAGGGTVAVDVFSPVTRRYYTMYCTAGLPTVCRGGNEAVVYIR
jgi:hypothetical protein